jgi:NAD(P)-dependent dehydrogenase (short-subunit alcohol dehydrogenase family)
VALVTGAARGLGAGIARALAAEGAAVAGADVGWGEAEPPPGVARVDLDVTDEPAVGDAVERVERELGPLDVLVNNAAIMQPDLALVETPSDVLRDVFAVNVVGVLNCCRAAAPRMRERRGGRIVNIASQTGKVPWPRMGAYSASKAAVINLTQCLALELAPWRILVNCVCPGTMWSESGMTDVVLSREAAARGESLEDALAARARTIPLGRLGTPEDVGAMVAWLASDEVAFTTGAALNLTGGEQVFF